MSSTALAAPNPKPSASKPAVAPNSNNVVTFGLKPAGATEKDFDPRSYYSFAATPGGKLQDHVAITNYSQKPLTLYLTTADAVNTAQGGFSLKSPRAKMSDVGSWVRLHMSKNPVTLPARATRIVAYTLEVPQNASPGDHAGGLQLTLVSSAKPHTGPNFQLLQSVGVRMFVRVSGTPAPKLQVENLQIHYDRAFANLVGGGKAVVTYQVRNVGNIALGARQRLKVSPAWLPFGEKQTSLPDITLLLPGNVVSETATLDKVYPEILMRAKLSLTPLVIPGSSLPKVPTFGGSAFFLAVPWLLLLIVILTPVAWYTLRQRARARYRAAGSHAAQVAR